MTTLIHPEPPAAPIHTSLGSSSPTTAASATGGLGHELRALALSLTTLVAIAPVIVLAWLVMWTAQVRLTPNPEAELMAELEARGGPVGPLLDAEYLEYGRKVFMGTCIACHGAGGRGTQGSGKDLVHSQFVAKHDDDFLVAFLKRGRDPSDPLNTTKVQMPPKGGNPVLTDDDLYDVVEFVRGLQDPRRIPKPGSKPVSHNTNGADASVASASH